MSMATGAGYGAKTPKGYDTYQLPTMEPAVHDWFTKLMGSSGQGALSGMENLKKLAGGDESYFQQLEAPAFRQFEGSMGQMGSRFAGMGMGANKSSGMRLSAGGMASDLAQNLQSQRMGLQQNAISQLMGMSQHLMGMPTMGTGLVQKQPSFWEQLLPGLMGGIGQGAGMGGGAAGMAKLLPLLGLV